MQEDSQIWNLLVKQLTGELTLEERQLLKRLEENPVYKELFEELQTIWAEARPPHQSLGSDKDFAWEKLEDQLDEAEAMVEMMPTSPAPLNPKFGIKRNVKWLAAAGIICLLLVGSFYLSSYFKPKQEIAKLETLPAIPETIRAESIPVPQVTPSIQIFSDSLELLILPDKSRVWLNKNSVLSYDSSFNQLDRQVTLLGEAFFEVRSDTTKPFIILANESKTSVLGTSFNLRAYKKEDPTVTVVTGKVAFTDNEVEQNQIVLIPGEKGIYDRTKSELSKRKNNNHHFLDWKHALVYKREIAAPASYLKGSFQKKKSLINQTEIQGKIHNDGTLATYRNIKLRVNFYNKKRRKHKSYIFTVYKPVPPGKTITYKYRLADWFNQTEQVNIKVVDAAVVRN